MAVQPVREVVAAAHLNKHPRLSIVVPVLNEYLNLPGIITQLSELVSETVSGPVFAQSIELIFVDGGSNDGSLELLQSVKSERFICIENEQGRALQMNAGAELARGELLLFLHADTRISQANIQELFSLWDEHERVWGRFDLAFDLRKVTHRTMSVSLRIVAWFINRRSRLTGIATGDQAIFVSRDAFDKVGGFKKQALMEDIELSKQLGALSKPLCLSSKVKTSPRKWQQEGVVPTVFLMWKIRLKYYFGVSAEKLVTEYYRK